MLEPNIHFETHFWLMESCWEIVQNEFSSLGAILIQQIDKAEADSKMQ